MQKNVGSKDRAVRIGLSLAMVGTAIFANLSGTWPLILSLGAILLLATVGRGVCPLYGALSLSTRRENAQGGEKR